MNINGMWEAFKIKLQENEEKLFPRELVIGRSGKYKYPLDKETLQKN